MSTIKNATNLTSTNSRVGKSYVPEARVVLFGNEGDPDIAHSMKKLKDQGRDVVVAPRPGFDTGTGLCGNHLCHCKEVCIARIV